VESRASPPVPPPYDYHAVIDAAVIDVAYDRTHLAQDDIAAASAAVRNNLAKTANMVMVGIMYLQLMHLRREDYDFQHYENAGNQGSRGLH